MPRWNRSRNHARGPGGGGVVFSRGPSAGSRRLFRISARSLQKLSSKRGNADARLPPVPSFFLSVFFQAAGNMRRAMKYERVRRGGCHHIARDRSPCDHRPSHPYNPSNFGVFPTRPTLRAACEGRGRPPPPPVGDGLAQQSL